MNTIRKFIGLFLLTLGVFILPKKKVTEKKKNEQKIASVEITKEFLTKATPVRFTDLHSYVEQIQQPIDNAGACITISHTLVSLSKKKNVPVRINLSLSMQLDKTGEIGNSSNCYLSEYKDGRWRKLKDLEISINSIVPLIDEVIGAMGQNGWGCMDNSREQIQQYLLDNIRHSLTYALDRCKKLDIKASIGVQVFIIVDGNERSGNNNKPQPQILAKVSVKTERDSPVESAHYIYFSRKPVTVEKPAT